MSDPKLKTWGLGTALALVMLLAIPARPQAGVFIVDRLGWNSMSAGAKEAYIRGVFDAVFAVFPVGSQEATEDLAVQQCAVRLKISARDLAIAVDHGYALEANRDRPPSALLIARMRDLCAEDLRAVQPPPALPASLPSPSPRTEPRPQAAPSGKPQPKRRR